jgi:hypothetical protein
MGYLLWVIGALAVVGGLVAFGVWAGRGLAADRAQDRANDALYEQNQARPRPGQIVMAGYITGAPDWQAPQWRIAGYAGPFPGPGSAAADLADVEEITRIDVPHVGPSRSAPSPVDLEADVRRMCDETELYVAALVASTRHAERNSIW